MLQHQYQLQTFRQTDCASGECSDLGLRIQRSGVRAPLGSNRVVSLSKAHLLPNVLVIPRKRWLRPNMTEKLFAGTLRINQPTNQDCASCEIRSILATIPRETTLNTFTTMSLNKLSCIIDPLTFVDPLQDSAKP